MITSSSLHSKLTEELYTSPQAQHLAYIIAFGPIVFQVARLMVKHGIFDLLGSSKSGLTIKEIVQQTQLSPYAIQCLMESSLTMGTVTVDEPCQRYSLSRVGWFLLNDPSIQVDMNFNHDVNYQGFFNLEEALLKGKPVGLSAFGHWETLYEGLSSLPENVQKSWLAFDHHYSNISFKEALDIIFKYNTSHILDIGGNTGLFAQACVEYDNNVKVTIVDLPQQISMLNKNIKNYNRHDRIIAIGMDILKPNTELPYKHNFDVIWMSQFLDCFSENDVVNILNKVAKIADDNCRICILEPIWDRQKYLPSAFALTQISLYFSVMANGYSKMFKSDDLERLINSSELVIDKIYDNLGKGLQSLIICKKK